MMRRILWLLAPVVAGAATDWTATRRLPAPEAHQAAAAEGKYVYAVTSRAVAKYDRATGERVAVSVGEARHLNSGFFHRGNLLCAHSNFPFKPERSEIKALDVDTMKLTTFKAFGQAGGSLTWALRKDGHWWCNFAHYGADNAKTFLAKYDDQWRESARWTYPRRVIEQLGRYSLSGGLWRGDELWVTGHDDPVAFRLRVPKGGGTLEFVGRLAVPFTGQGFADDPVTGGLVGIDRARKQVVLAERQGVRVRVLCYNVHHGAGVDGKLDLPRIAKVIQSVKPDLVALQEVDKGAGRSGRVDQAAELARLTGMRHVFGANIPLQGGHYGNAVLSRLPIAGRRNHLLPNVDSGEQRGALEVHFKGPGKQPLRLFATHLDHRRPDKERLASAVFLNAMADKQNTAPTLLAGDLNDVLGSRVLKEFQKAWTPTNVRPMPTSPAGKPIRQIDFILFRPAARWKVIETKVLDEAEASDHRPIFAILELRV